jgi:hypothetical protein
VYIRLQNAGTKSRLSFSESLRPQSQRNLAGCMLQAVRWKTIATAIDAINRRRDSLVMADGFVVIVHRSIRVAELAVRIRHRRIQPNVNQPNCTARHARFRLLTTAHPSWHDTVDSAEYRVGTAPACAMPVGTAERIGRIVIATV